MEAWKEEMLMHSGRKGMRWGHRLYRNEDGTLTDAGRLRYGVGPARDGSSSVALTTRSNLSSRTFKTSSNAKRLDQPSTDDLISSSKKLLGESTENEKLTEQFLRDVGNRKVTMEDLEKGLPKEEMGLAIPYNPAKTNKFFEEHGLVIRKANSQNTADAEDVDERGLAIRNPDSDVIGNGKSVKGEKSKKVVDADYEEVKGAPKAEKKVDPKASQPAKSEPKKSDDSTVSAPEKKTMTKEEREERRKSLALKGAAVKTLTNESKSILDNTNSVYSMLKKTSRMNNIDYSKMTNDDLKKQTERLNLERNYREAVGNNVGNHERRVNAFLSTTGSALAVAGSAIGIAIAIKQLRNG